MMLDELDTNSAIDDGSVNPTIETETVEGNTNQSSTQDQLAPSSGELQLLREQLAEERQRNAAARVGGAAAARERDELRLQLQQAMSHSPQSQIGEDGYTQDERSALQEAIEDSDIARYDKVRNQIQRRQNQLLVAGTLQAAQLVSQQSAQAQSTEATLRSLDLTDQNLIREAVNLQTNEGLSHFFQSNKAEDYVQVADGWVNKQALLAARHAQAKRGRRNGGDPVSRPKANNGNQFNPSVHLTAEERHQIDNWSGSTPITYEDFWKHLPQSEKKERMSG